jgi:cation transport ATPase
VVADVGVDQRLGPSGPQLVNVAAVSGSTAAWWRQAPFNPGDHRLAMAFLSVFVVSNSLRLRRFTSAA